MRRSRRNIDLPELARCRLGGSYERYITSDTWMYSPARLSEIAAAGNRCRLCDRGPPEAVLTVHHRTYVRLGRELPQDLTALCLECHDTVTDLLRTRALAGTALPRAVDVPLSTPRQLVDSLHERLS